MSNKKEKLLEILKQINKQFSKQEAVNKSCRERNAELVSNFIDAGGWVGCGYTSLNKMFEENGHLFGFRQQWLHAILSVHNYETLLGIPLGTYSFKDFEGFRLQFIKPPTYGGKDKFKHGISCDIEKAKQVKEKWDCLTDYCQKPLPNDQEIYEACKELFGTKAKKTQTSGGYYQQKALESKAELQTIQTKAKEEIEKYQTEIKGLRFKMVQLEEENRRLKQQLIERSKKVAVRFSVN